MTKDNLTNRERQILQLIASGLKARGIAMRLALSYHTVKAHRSNIYAKLDARSGPHAVAKGMRRGFIK